MIFLIFILVFGGVFVNQVKGSQPVPQIWGIAEDISWIESILHSTRLIQTIVGPGVEVKKTVKKMFTIHLDGLEARNLTGFQQDLMEITRVFDEQCPSDEGCKVGGDLKKGIKLMKKLEEFSTLEQRIPHLILLGKVDKTRFSIDNINFDGISCLNKINEYPKLDRGEDYRCMATVAITANETIHFIPKWRELVLMAAELNATRTEEELDFLIRLQNKTLKLSIEQSLLNGFATSVESLKSRTEKLKAVVDKVEKVISQLDWLVGIEDGVMDPLNNHSLIANIRIADVERVTDGMIKTRLATLTQLDVNVIGNQLESLRNAKERLEKWLTLRRALKTSGGAAVESGLVRSVLGNVKQGLEQLPTVKSVRECTDHFNVTNLSNTSLHTFRSYLRDEVADALVKTVDSFNAIGFSDDDLNVTRQLFRDRKIDYAANIRKWKSIPTIQTVIGKLQAIRNACFLAHPFIFEEGGQVDDWLKANGFMKGMTCMKKDGKIDSANETVLSELSRLYSNDSRLPLIVEMSTNLTQIEQMWKSEVDNKMSMSGGKIISKDIDDTTKMFRSIASAMRAASMVIRYENEFETILNSSEVMNMTVESLSAEEKRKVGWTSEFPLCLSELKAIASKLRTHHGNLNKYDGLESLIPLVEHLEGTYRCESTDIFARLMPHTNGPLNAALKTFENVSLDFSDIRNVVLNLKEVSEVLEDIGTEDTTTATTTIPISSSVKSQDDVITSIPTNAESQDDVTSVPTNAESFKQVQDQNSINNKSEDGDDESAVSSVVWIIIVLVVLLVIAGLSVAVYFRFFHKKTKRESAEVEKKTENVDKTAGTTAGSGEKIQKDSATGNVAVPP